MLLVYYFINHIIGVQETFFERINLGLGNMAIDVLKTLALFFRLTYIYFVRQGTLQNCMKSVSVCIYLLVHNFWNPQVTGTLLQKNHCCKH